MLLEIKNLNKSYQDISLFNDFNIEIKENTISCILGPSGCGKTTLLNIINGTINADSVELKGFENKVISYIFQEPRLLPWKTVRENIAFVIKDIENKEETVERYIRLVELGKFADYYPSKLSGGMKQRVSIARAFAYPSDIILMDEPLKALDIKLKLNLIKSFKRIWQFDKRTVVFVTHDIDEALLLGNELFVFSKAPVIIKDKFILSAGSSEISLENQEMIDLKKRILKIMD